MNNSDMINKILIDFNNPFNNEIVIIGIVRNIANTFLEDYSWFSKALKNFRSVNWFLLESDSEDNTLNILKSTSDLNSNFS